MHDPIRAFLDRLDKELLAFAQEGERLDMYLLGRAALVLHFAFPLATADVDIVWMRDSGLEQKAIDLVRKGSPLAEALGLYLDPVAEAFPPVPGWFRKRCQPIAGDWKVLRPWVLEVHDLAVTKLKSFRPKDREDLQILCDRGLLNAEELRQALSKAFPFRSPKPEDAEDDPDNPDWGKALASMRRVEAYLTGSVASI
jgi:Nucleotidyltransferase of unknown function (DUF6036)